MTTRNLLLHGLVTACTLVQFPIAGSSQPNNPAEVQFEAARKIETIDGNLRKAIEQYRKLLSFNKSDRALSARALLRIGICQERLAQADAKKSYEQILREYSANLKTDPPAGLDS